MPIKRNENDGTRKISAVVIEFNSPKHRIRNSSRTYTNHQSKIYYAKDQRCRREKNSQYQPQYIPEISFLHEIHDLLYIL